MPIQRNILTLYIYWITKQWPDFSCLWPAYCTVLLSLYVPLQPNPTIRLCLLWNLVKSILKWWSPVRIHHSSAACLQELHVSRVWNVTFLINVRVSQAIFTIIVSCTTPPYTHTFLSPLTWTEKIKRQHVSFLRINALPTWQCYPST